MSKVFVASLSPIKTSAVKETVNELLAKNYGAVNVQGVDTKSGINEQPVGLDETYKGACNRVNHAKSIINEPYLFIVGIENGIVNIGDKWIDLAVVVLEDKDGVSYTSTSTGIVFDNKFVNKAKEKGFDKVTVGSIMAAEFGKSCKSTDPHEYLTAGVLPRKDTLLLAVRAVVGQLLYSHSHSQSHSNTIPIPPYPLFFHSTPQIQSSPVHNK